MIRYLAAELGRRNIRINAVGCGPVGTKALAAMVRDEALVVEDGLRRMPLQPPAGAREVAEIVAFLSTEPGRAFTGQVLTADGGLSLWM
jgi:enoyl-[acyl-carrier protein] reductase I